MTTEELREELYEIWLRWWECRGITSIEEVKEKQLTLINRYRSDVCNKKVNAITEFLEGIKGSQYSKTGKVPEQIEIIYDSMIRDIKAFFMEPT